MQMQLQQRSQQDDGLIPNAASHVTFQLPSTNSIQREVSQILKLPQQPSPAIHLTYVMRKEHFLESTA